MLLFHSEEIGTIYCSKPNDINKANPIHVEENNVGIEAWASKYIFKYSYKVMFQRRNNNRAEVLTWNSDNYFHVMKFTRFVFLSSKEFFEMLYSYTEYPYLILLILLSNSTWKNLYK